MVYQVNERQWAALFPQYLKRAERRKVVTELVEELMDQLHPLQEELKQLDADDNLLVNTIRGGGLR
jgi:hypothetical protein